MEGTGVVFVLFLSIFRRFVFLAFILSHFPLLFFTSVSVGFL